MNRIALGIALVTVLGACGSAESSEDLEGQALADSVEARASRPASAPAPRASAPAPRATAPAQPVRAIPAGTLLTFEVRENVSTSSHSAGDSFSLVLVDGVSGPAGAVLAAGASARGLVTNSHSSTGADDQSVLGLRVATVEAGGSQRSVSGQAESADIQSSARSSGTRQVATVATGAAAGAIIGQIIGRDTRATVTGAAVGAAVGVGVALTTRGGHAELPVGSRIVVRLTEDLVY